MSNHPARDGDDPYSSRSLQPVAAEFDVNEDMYKMKIEALRQDFGNTWLNALEDENWDDASDTSFPSEVDGKQQLQQAKTLPEASATHEPVDTIPSIDAGTSHSNHRPKSQSDDQTPKSKSPAKTWSESRALLPTMPMATLESEAPGIKVHGGENMEMTPRQMRRRSFYYRNLQKPASHATKSRGYAKTPFSYATKPASYAETLSSHPGTMFRHLENRSYSVKVYDTLMGFIKRFVGIVYDKSGTQYWGNHTAVHSSPSTAEKNLVGLLEGYTTGLLSKAAVNSSTVIYDNDVRLNLFAAVLIRHYRVPIAHYFWEALSQKPSPRDIDVLALIRQLGVPDFERLAIRVKSMTNIGHPKGIRSPKAGYTIQPPGFLEGRMTDEELDDIVNVLNSTDALQLLALNVRRSLYRDDSDAICTIETTMSEENLVKTAYGGYKADIHVPWSIEKFMHNQYGEDVPNFGSVVTLTGSSLFAQASTCADYIQKTWPYTGKFFLELLDAFHATFTALNKREPGRISLTEDRGLFVEAYINRSRDSSTFAKFSAHAMDKYLLVQLTQQLSWLSSAFTTSPFEKQLAHSNLVFLQPKIGLFEITIHHEPIGELEKACWLPLFDGACIATGFPISERAQEIGLDIPLDLLAGLSGSRHVVEYEGGLVMKGFSHMFVPVRRQLDRVQWHAISSPDEKTPLSYHDGISRCKSRAMLHEVSLQDLASLRAIVGWCSVAITCLGSSNVNYKNIDYTKTSEADSGPRCTGTSFGFQQFGVAALDVKFGLKDGKSHFQRAGPYRRIIQLAEGSPIVLHDVEGRRSWLVPATNVMLHVVQHRHHLNPFQVNGKSISLDTSIAKGSSAKEVLLKNRTQVLYEDDNYTFMDDVLNTWSILEFLLAQNISRQREAPGVPIPSSWHENLYGFEFKAVVLEDAPYKLKKTTISRTHGGWSKLIEDIDALVLFANGFGDIILPAGEPNQDLCHKWRTVPHGKDYLTTTTDMLNKLFDRAGSRLD